MIRCLSSSLFKRSFVFFVFSLFFLSLLIYFSMIRREEKDLAAYENLIQENAKLRRKKTLDKTGSTQIRSDVQKDIWQVRGKQESHIRISSEFSSLNIQEKDKKLYAKETFGALKGWIEPNDADSYQIESKEGFYELPNHKLFAKEVKLSKDLTFFLEADNAFLENLRDPLKLEGNVRFVSLLWQDKQTYALAQKASYFPQNELFVLNGSKENPVLCWQNGSAFVAPEIHMKKDSKMVQAIGDVRCSFDSEEQETLKEIFSRYL